MAVAKHDIDPAHGMGCHMRAGSGRHRVAIHHERIPEGLARPVDEIGKGAVIGPVDRFYAKERIGELERSAIDFITLADNARDRAEPPGDPHRGDIGKARQILPEHARIELIGLAIHIEIGAREMRMQQRRAEIGGKGEEFVDVAVFRFAQCVGIEAGSGEEILRIGTAAVR